MSSIATLNPADSTPNDGLLQTFGRENAPRPAAADHAPERSQRPDAPASDKPDRNFDDHLDSDRPVDQEAVTESDTGNTSGQPTEEAPQAEAGIDPALAQAMQELEGMLLEQDGNLVLQTDDETVTVDDELLAALGLTTDADGKVVPLEQEAVATDQVALTDDGDDGTLISQAGQTGLAKADTKQSGPTGPEVDATNRGPATALDATTDADTDRPIEILNATGQTGQQQAAANVGHNAKVEQTGPVGQQTMAVEEVAVEKAAQKTGPQQNTGGPDAIQAPVLDEILTTSTQNRTTTAPSLNFAMQEVETAVDKALANQVAKAVTAQAADGQRVLTLRLTPPELGTVRIQIVEQAGTMQVKLGAEDDGVRAALDRALPSLRQELRQSETVVEIDMADHFLQFTQDDGRDRQAGDRSQGQSRGNQAQFSLNGDYTDDLLTTTSTIGGIVANDLVDARA